MSDINEKITQEYDASKIQVLEGLEAVAHVGQRTADDDAHRILDIARRHLADQLRLDYVLIGKSNVFRFIILILTCHFFRGELTPLLYFYCVNPVS